MCQHKPHLWLLWRYCPIFIASLLHSLECKRRFSIKLWKTFTDCFNCLPIAALIDEKIFCCHGGLSPDLQNMEQIRRIMRPTDVPDTGLLCDLLWSDPDKVGIDLASFGLKVGISGCARLGRKWQVNLLSIEDTLSRWNPKTCGFPWWNVLNDGWICMEFELQRCEVSKKFWVRRFPSKIILIRENLFSFTFGPDVVAKFLNRHDLDLICRAHQVVEDGYEFFAKRQLVTLFSAPNYCGEFDNAGGMMSVDETLMCSFQILKPSEKVSAFQALNSSGLFTFRKPNISTQAWIVGDRLTRLKDNNRGPHKRRSDDHYFVELYSGNKKAGFCCNYNVFVLFPSNWRSSPPPLPSIKACLLHPIRVSLVRFCRPVVCLLNPNFYAKEELKRTLRISISCFLHFLSTLKLFYNYHLFYRA